MGAYEDMRVDAPDAGEFAVRRVDDSAEYGISAVDTAGAFGRDSVAADGFQSAQSLVGQFSVTAHAVGGTVGAAKDVARMASSVDEEGRRLPAVAHAVADSARDGFVQWAKSRPEAAWRFLRNQTQSAWQPEGADQGASGEGFDDLTGIADRAYRTPGAVDRARGAVQARAENRLANWDNRAVRHEMKAEKAAEALAGGSKGTAAFLAGDDIPVAGTGIPDLGGRAVASDGVSPTPARRSVGDALSRFKVRYHSEKAARLRGDAGGILGKIHKARRSKNDAVSKVARRPIFFLAAPAAIIALVLFGMVGCSVVSSAAAGIVSIAGSQSAGQNAALNAVENQVASFFIQKGLTPLQTAAIMGNMYGESGMQPGVIQGLGVVGESYDNQTILSFGNASGLGAGLAQWDSGRRANLARYAESVGMSWSDVAVQLDYFWDHDEWADWGGNESRRSSFLSTDDLDTAVEDFAFGWERCNPAKAHLNVRKTAAQRYYLALTVQSGAGTGQDYASASGAQKAVADAALTMGSFGASQGWCQKWVKNVYGSVGRSSASACCAHAAGDSWIVSTSSSGIPVGATVYSSRSYGNVQCTACGRDACHVGIYVGDGTVISMEDGVRARTVEEWISVYGWRGWGWNGGDDLTR